MNIEQRCQDLERRFDLCISVKTLRLIYDKHHVKMKKVMKKKPSTPFHLIEKRKTEARLLKYALEYLDEKNIKLYFLDECSFSARAYKKDTWSNVHKNVEIDFQRSPPYVSLSAIIDCSGVVNYSLIQKAHKEADHWRFLRTFRQDLGHGS